MGLGFLKRNKDQNSRTKRHWNRKGFKRKKTNMRAFDEIPTQQTKNHCNENQQY